MVVEILAVNRGGAIDFADCRLNLFVGGAEIAHHVGFVMDAHQHLSGAQIGAGAQVSRVTPRRVGTYYDRRKHYSKRQQSSAKVFELH